MDAISNIIGAVSNTLILDTPQAAVTKANTAISNAYHKGYEAGRIEFSAFNNSQLAIAIKFKKTATPKTKTIVITTDIDQWDGDAAANHPIIPILSIFWYLGIVTTT